MVETGAYVLVYSIHYTASFLGELIGRNYNYVPLLMPSVTLFFENFTGELANSRPVCSLKVIIIHNELISLWKNRRA